MSIYDEAAAIEQIRSIGLEGRLHLSHVVRNGLCLVLAAHMLGGNVERVVYEFESRWKELE